MRSKVILTGSGGTKMKYWVWGILIGIFCAGAWADDAYHNFTDSQGRTITARIVSLNTRSQAIRVELESGKKGNIDISQLSGEDQEYVENWNIAKQFMNERRLRISAKRKESENDEMSRDGGNSNREVTNAGYEITIENTSDVEFENVAIEYCIFYEQETQGTAGRNNKDQGVLCGTLDIETIPAKSKQTVLTDTVLIYHFELDSNWYYTSGAANAQRGDVHGIWLRASLESLAQIKAERKYSLPDSLPNSKQWSTKTVRVGMN